MNNKATLNLNYSGRFKAEVLKDNEVVRESCWSDNVIVNNFLNNVASDSGNTGGLSSVAVGTGTSEPSVTDTSLDNQVATTSNDVSNNEINQITTVPYYCSLTYVFIFNIGDVSGNITEVSANSFTGGIVSRALFRDEFGDPTSVTVLADEQLRITYEGRVTIPDEDTVASVDGYTLTIRPSGADNTTAWGFGNSVFINANRANVYSGSIGDIDSTPSGGSNTQASAVNAEPYVSNSFQREITYTWDTTRANFDIASALFRVGMQWQVGIDPVIPKTSSDLLNITIVVSFGRP
tara:strand:- start:16977 stop:17855 length:879 start_codon:yes stop_codon:yes gene_type:complete